MKPRPTTPLTEEDERIWWRVGLRAPMEPLKVLALAADRRDAALMWRLTQTRALSPPNARAVCHSLLLFGFEPSQWP